MSRELAIPKSHTILFKPVRIGSEWSLPEQINITKEQYEGLKECTTPLVEIDGELFSVSEIRSVQKIPTPKPKRPERYMFDTDEEYNAAEKEYQSKQW